jgi:hypothetical protein
MNELKNILNSNKACYHSVQNLLFFHLLSKNITIKILHKTIILPIVLYGYETLDPQISGRMFENRLPRGIF